MIIFTKKTVAVASKRVPTEADEKLALDVLKQLKKLEPPVPLVLIGKLLDKKNPLSTWVAQAKADPTRYSKNTYDAVLAELKRLFKLPHEKPATTDLQKEGSLREKSDLVTQIDEILVLGTACRRLKLNQDIPFQSEYERALDRYEQLSVIQSLQEDSFLEKSDLDQISLTITGVSIQTHLNLIEDAMPPLVSMAIDTAFLSFITGPLDATALLKIPFVPDPDPARHHFTPSTLNKLGIMFDTFYPHSSEKDPITQWAMIICAVKGVHVTLKLVGSIISEGKVGRELNHLLEGLPSHLATPINGLLTHIRAQAQLSSEHAATARTNNDFESVEKFVKDKKRWEMAECRIGDGVVVLLDHLADGPLTEDQTHDVLVCIDRWKTVLADVCSVGQDFQLASFPVELKAILTGGPKLTQSDEQRARDLRSDCAGWAMSKIIQSLSMIGIPRMMLEEAVHDINSAAKEICLYFRFDVPEALADPHAAGFGDLIEEHRESIAKHFDEPWQMVMQRWQDAQLDPKSSQLSAALTCFTQSGYFSEQTAVALTTDQKLSFMESAMRTATPREFQTLLGLENGQDAMKALHQALISEGAAHGLLGAAAKSGNKDCFESLWHLLKPADAKQALEEVMKTDDYGLTLVEFLVLGGNDSGITLLEQSFQAPHARAWKAQIQGIIHRCQSENRANLFVLAAESGKVDMLAKVKELIDSLGEVDLAGNLLCESDNEDYTPLMRAMLTKSLACVEFILHHLPQETLEEGNLNPQGIDDCNKHGQSAAFMAVDLDNPGLLQLLLRHGANPNSKIDSTGFSMLHNAMLKGHLGCVRLLLLHPDSEVMIETEDYETPIGYASSASAVMCYLERPFLESPQGQLSWDAVMVYAADSGKLTRSHWLEVIDTSFCLSQKQDGEDRLEHLLKTVEKKGLLTAADWIALLQKAKEFNTPPLTHQAIYSVFLGAIKSGTLEITQLESIFDEAFKLAQSPQEQALLCGEVIAKNPPDEAFVKRLVYIIITQADLNALTDLLDVVTKSTQVNGEFWKELTEFVIPENPATPTDHTDRTWHVLRAAMRSSKLDDATVLSTLERAKGESFTDKNKVDLFLFAVKYNQLSPSTVSLAMCDLLSFHASRIKTIEEGLHYPADKQIQKIISVASDGELHLLKEEDWLAIYNHAQTLPISSYLLLRLMTEAASGAELSEETLCVFIEKSFEFQPGETVEFLEVIKYSTPRREGFLNNASCVRLLNSARACSAPKEVMQKLMACIPPTSLSADEWCNYALSALEQDHFLCILGHVWPLNILETKHWDDLFRRIHRKHI